MKKDKIKVYFDVDNKWYIPVFYLRENLAYENFALGDVGIEQPISEKEMWDKVGPHAEAKFIKDMGQIIDDAGCNVATGKYMGVRLLIPF